MVKITMQTKPKQISIACMRLYMVWYGMNIPNEVENQKNEREKRL